MIITGCDFMEVKDKIQPYEIKPIEDILTQTFDSILRQYNSLLYAIKDNAGLNAIGIAEDELSRKNIDISNFPNRNQMQLYITQYIQNIPVIARLQEHINNNTYPKNIKNNEQVKKELMEVQLNLNVRRGLLHDSENGMQKILMEWAMIQFIIENPNRVSISTMEQLIEHGYQGTCGTSIMKEMVGLIQQLHQLKIENDKLRKESALAQQVKQKKFD